MARAMRFDRLDCHSTTTDIDGTGTMEEGEEGTLGSFPGRPLRWSPSGGELNLESGSIKHTHRGDFTNWTVPIGQNFNQFHSLSNLVLLFDDSVFYGWTYSFSFCNNLDLGMGCEFQVAF